MSVYEFELVAYTYGVLDDHSVDALFEAGCGDATFGDGTGVVTAMFARETSTLTDAVMSAIAVGGPTKVAFDAHRSSRS